MAALLVGVAIWFGDSLLRFLAAPDLSWRLWMLVLGPPIGFVLYALWRRFQLPDETRAVRFGSDAVALPASPDTKRTVELPYEEVHGVLIMSRGRSHSVVIDTGDDTIAYSEGQFARPEGPELVRQALIRRIEQLPNAAEVRDRMREHQKRVRIATSKPATVTKVLLGTLAAVYLIELWTNALENPLGMVQLGANVPALVADGQYFRLISANFLHASWAHIILNGIALLFLGGAVEKLVGPWRLLLIYLLGAIGGSVGSYLAGPAGMSVGSSTAIFGLFGAFAVLHIRYWNQLSPPFRQSVRWWVVIVGLNAFLPILWPAIDYAAHLAGMGAGAVVAWALLAPMDQLKPDHRPSKWVKGITVAVSALFVVGLAQAAYYAVDTFPDREDEVISAMVEHALDKEADPRRVNQIAWLTATDPGASAEQLRQVLGPLTQITESEESRPEFLDTLATVNYRLAKLAQGDERGELIAEAVAIEQAVLEEEPDQPGLMGDGAATYASQLARFLDFLRESDGPLIAEDGFGSAPTLTFDPSEDGTLRIEAPAAAERAVNVYAVAKADKEISGLVRVCLPAGQTERTLEDDTLARWPNNLRLYVGLAGPAEGACEEGVKFWSMTSEIRQLP